MTEKKQRNSDEKSNNSPSKSNDDELDSNDSYSNAIEKESQGRRGPKSRASTVTRKARGRPKGQTKLNF